MNLDLVGWDDLIFAGIVVGSILLFAVFTYVLFRHKMESTEHSE